MSWDMNGELGKLEKFDKRKLPLIYRIILKLPKPSIDFLPDVSQGIFWAIVVPLFLLAEFFISLILLVTFPFPANILLISIIPTVVFLIFVRIMLERFLNLLNAAMGQQGLEWNIEKVTKEYFDIIEKRKSKKNKD